MKEAIDDGMVIWEYSNAAIHALQQIPSNKETLLQIPIIIIVLIFFDCFVWPLALTQSQLLLQSTKIMVMVYGDNHKST